MTITIYYKNGRVRVFDTKEFNTSDTFKNDNPTNQTECDSEHNNNLAAGQLIVMWNKVLEDGLVVVVNYHGLDYIEDLMKYKYKYDDLEVDYSTHMLGRAIIIITKQEIEDKVSSIWCNDECYLFWDYDSQKFVNLAKLNNYKKIMKCKKELFDDIAEINTNMKYEDKQEQYWEQKFGLSWEFVNNLINPVKNNNYNKTISDSDKTKDEANASLSD